MSTAEKGKKKVRGSVWSRHCWGEGPSPLEMNQFEVFFCINVIQKTLHNFFQSNKSYPQLSGVFPTFFLVLIGFFSLLFLYWPCRQPPQRIIIPGNLLLGTIPASMGSPTRSPQVLVTPGVMQSLTPSPEHLGCQQTPRWGAGAWVMGEQQQISLCCCW